LAWRRNHRYASIICNLEKRRVVTLLPDREAATAQAWLAVHPTISVIARDRGGGYGEAAARALPHAVQVADRWHLMENASRAFLDAVRKSMRQVRKVIGATRIDPDLLTAAERIQYEGYLRREETNASILELSKRRNADQADRAPDRPQQEACATGHPRRADRCLPDPAQFVGRASAMARRTMGLRLPKRRRTLATIDVARLRAFTPRRWRVGNAQAAGGTS
jgi:transposase